MSPDETGVDRTTGSKQRALDLVAAIRTLKLVEREDRPAFPHEREILARFGGFGAVAGYIFQDPSPDTKHPNPYKREGWQSQTAKQLGHELLELLTPIEMASAKRTTFNAFYTSPLVMSAIYQAIDRFGVPQDARVLEPGCGVGRFISAGPPAMRFTGVELDSLSGRIAKAIHPEADIRIENYRDTRLPKGIEAVVGNVPFAEITLDHAGRRFSLHDYFFAKSLDGLAPGGVMGLVTSRYTLDKINGEARDYLADRADLLGAIRLPDEAFKDQGTRVVTDILFLRKRHPGEAEADPTWRGTSQVDIGDKTATINGYFAARPEMILGDLALDRGMYNAETLKVRAGADYPERLHHAVRSLPEGVFSAERRSPAHQPKAASVIPAGLGEGSFFVGPDKAIMQIECGEAVPVCHGTRPLSATDGLMGRRLAALIELRNDARHVLASQNAGWPVEDRDNARRSLNRSYDRFTGEFGPINKTTFSVNAQGTEVRRMPNVARFREDPDAFLVMSLEDYDDATGNAERAPIMRQDVVGPSAPVGKVGSAEEGLLVSLNERGRVDLGHIEALYGRPESEILTELGDLVFHDPEADAWVVRDAYLSGNVRRKLAVAEAAGLTRNAEALRSVQPEDLLPGDIDANLGAPWLPVDVIREFAADLLSVSPSDITVAHLPKDAIWSVEGKYAAQSSVANTSEFGTGRIDALTLIDQALNLKNPTIYDVVRDSDGERRVLNQTETIAAREKQKRIKQRFAGWVFADPDRAEQLVRIYNDGFNNLRPQEYDGSHLTFPGMNPNFTLRPHQVNAVWRNMSSGNTMLAHCVGAGKTSCMAATAMKLRQTGLIRKAVLVVPNHVLEQFGREFYQVYPNAKLLVADKDDLARDRRKLLTAKIATGDWDAIIMTHSSFERVGMSAEFQRQFMQNEIDAYNALLIEAKTESARDDDRAHRNIIKQIEKRKTAFEDKLKALSADKKKDDGLVFDDLGVDHFFYDEAHAAKNLSAASKMERVSGIQTEGSQRAFDIYMKTQYLNGKSHGRGVTFATGTPISNSMVELYTMMRYLAPDMLKERGIDHFDAWAASFGEVVDLMEISPDGKSLRPNARFAKFINLPELQTMFRSFADVQTADMLKLPVPALRGGKADIVSAPMSDLQRDIQDNLVARFERIRRGGVDPREDNALAITTDGRKLALDARLVDPTAADDPDSKLNALIDNVVEVWKRTEPQRGTQLIFCDFGVNPNDWGFSVYDEIKTKLARAGIPPEEVADIGDANSDAKKGVLFEKVRSGRVRVLLGSTAKMGTGTNVQTRLVALHHLDAPWKPAEVEQRDGRILRQGNTNPEVEIYRYVTEGSFDAFMWQGLERKARFINQVMTGKAGVRRADDIGGAELSFAEVKAIASGNPAVLTLAEIEADIQRLAMLKRSHADDQYRARQQVKHLPEDIARLERRAQAFEADYAAASEPHEIITVAGRDYRSREKAVEAMNDLLKHYLAAAGDETQSQLLGRYRGFDLTVNTRRGSIPELQVSRQSTRFLDFRNVAAGSLLNRVDDKIDAMPADAARDRETRRLKVGQLEAFTDRVGQPFDQAERLDRLQYLRHMLETALSNEADRSKVDDLVAEYKGLKVEVPVAEMVREQPTAEILPFPLIEVEHPVEIEPEVVKSVDLSERPRPVLVKTDMPVHQGGLFDRMPERKPQRPAANFREAVRRKEKPVQLGFNF